MYYLQSRYYDPALGRFINADSYASTGQGFIGCNMFAYCGNNPINFEDSYATKPSKYHDCRGGVMGYTDTGTGTTNNSYSAGTGIDTLRNSANQMLNEISKAREAAFNAFFRSIEGSIGLGMGLQATGTVAEAGVNCGIHYNPVELILEDGKFYLCSTSEEIAEIDLILIRYGGSRTECTNLQTQLTSIKETGPIEVNESYGVSGAFYAGYGGSVSFKINVVKFIQYFNGEYN